MVITEEQRVKLISISLQKTVSFQKGDTVFVDKSCQMLTTPLKAYLKTLEAKQVYDRETATYIVVRSLSMSIYDVYMFEGGTWFDKAKGVYQTHRKDDATSWGRDAILKEKENHFNYVWNEHVIQGSTDRVSLSAEFCLETSAIFIQEDVLQSVVYQWQKDNVWDKISVAHIDKITFLLETETNTNTDIAVKMINRFDPTDVMARLILLYHSYSTTIYTKKMLRNKVFRKDPELYKLIRNNDCYNGKRELGHWFINGGTRKNLAKYVSDDDISSFLSV